MNFQRTIFVKSEDCISIRICKLIAKTFVLRLNGIEDDWDICVIDFPIYLVSDIFLRVLVFPNVLFLQIESNDFHGVHSSEESDAEIVRVSHTFLLENWIKIDLPSLFKWIYSGTIIQTKPVIINDTKKIKNVAKQHSSLAVSF